MSDGLTHLNSSGEANMVDVTGRDVTVREAIASGKVKKLGLCVNNHI